MIDDAVFLTFSLYHVVQKHGEIVCMTGDGVVRRIFV